MADFCELTEGVSNRVEATVDDLHLTRAPFSGMLCLPLAPITVTRMV